MYYYLFKMKVWLKIQLRQTGDSGHLHQQWSSTGDPSGSDLKMIIIDRNNIVYLLIPLISCLLFDYFHSCQ